MNPLSGFLTEFSGLRTVPGRGDEAAVPPLDEAELLEAGEVVRRELAAGPQGAGHGGGPRDTEAADREEDAKADVPVLPMLLVQPVPLREGAAADGVEPPLRLLPLADDEAAANQLPEVVAGRAQVEAQGARDRAQVVPGEAEEVLVDPPADGVVLRRLPSGERRELDPQRPAWCRERRAQNVDPLREFRTVSIPGSV